MQRLTVLQTQNAGLNVLPQPLRRIDRLPTSGLWQNNGELFSAKAAYDVNFAQRF